MGRKPTEKESFFKVLLGDFSNQLCIPPKFIKNHIRRRSLGKCVLQGPSGGCWRVELGKRENGFFFHSDGWQRFVKDHLLQVGDFLVFRYDGKSKFKVEMFDRTCCKKDVEVAKRGVGVHEAPPAKEGGQLPRVEDEIVDLEAKNCDEDTENDDSRRRNNGKFGKQTRVGDGKETSSAGSSIFKSECSCLKLTLKSKSRYMVFIPRGLAVAEGLLHKKEISIRDPTGRIWSAKLTTVTRELHNKIFDYVIMTTGWGECRKANKISLGDTVVFEFVKPGMIQLTI